MITSRTGLSAVPSVSLPQLTSPAGSRLMIMEPTAGTGAPPGAIANGDQVSHRDPGDAAHHPAQPGPAIAGGEPRVGTGGGW